MIQITSSEKQNDKIKPKQKLGNKTGLVIGIAAIIFYVFLIVSMVIGFGGGWKSRKTKITPTTPLQPEATLENFSSEEIKYVETMSKIFKDFNDANFSLADLLETKSFLLWTDKEIITAAADTIIIEQSYGLVKALTPPERFEKAHDLLLSGLEKDALAMPLFRFGIDNLNVDKIEQATKLMYEGIDFLEQGDEELNNMIMDF